MKQYLLSASGRLHHNNGQPCTAKEVDSREVAVPHLTPHVERWTLPRGENIGVLVVYSCHCWTSQYRSEPGVDELKIMDGLRARIFDSARFEASKELPELISSMQRFRIYVTSSERNYGVYNMRFTASDGLSYTAFFMVRKKKGRFDGVRHTLVLSVESAYRIAQPQKGMKTSLRAILAAALRGETVRYRR